MASTGTQLYSLFFNDILLFKFFEVLCLDFATSANILKVFNGPLPFQNRVNWNSAVDALSGNSSILNPTMVAD